MTLRITAWSWLALFLSPFLWAASHGLDGRWVTTADDAPQMSLRLNSKRQRLEVTLPKSAELREPTIGITFFRNDGTQTTWELTAVRQSRPGSAGQTAGPSMFQGSLSPWDSSYIGFELRIPLASGSKVVPFSQLKRVSR